MTELEWTGKRGQGDWMVGIVVVVGLALVVLVIVAVFVLGWLNPEAFEYKRGVAIGPTPVALEDLGPFGASFTDVAEEAGVSKIQASGATGERLLPETMGSGVALGDLDGDLDADLLLLSYGSTPALYRNDSPKGGPIRFTDVTRGSGLESIEHSTTAALGDFDGDGRLDVLVGTVGPDHLLRNVGEMRFEPVRQMGDGWTSAAGFADIDADHDLDLVVASYVEWSPEIDREVNYTLDGIGRAYGPPNGFKATDLALYVNDGSGSFTEESADRGLRVRRDDRGIPVMKALGMLTEPLNYENAGPNADGVDIIIANDTTGNRVFSNDGSGQFTDRSLESGLAYDLDGRPTGAMGIDRSNYGHYSHLLVIGNFANEPSSVYQQDYDQYSDKTIFSDIASTSGVGPATRTPLTFGTLLFDADLDGHMDLLQVNGHIEPEIARVQEGQTYRQRAQLFRGTGKWPSFLEVPAEELGDLSEPIVGRAAASADLDRDGDTDLVISRIDGVPRILRNDVVLPPGSQPITIRLVGSGANRGAFGSVLTVQMSGRRNQERIVSPTRSYMSQCDTAQVFVLPPKASLGSIDVWFLGGANLHIRSPGTVKEIVIREPTNPSEQ